MDAGSGIRYVLEAAMVIAGNVTLIPSNVSGTRVTVVGVAPFATSSPIPDPVGAESPPAVAADRVSAAAGRCTGDCTVRVAMRDSFAAGAVRCGNERLHGGLRQPVR